MKASEQYLDCLVLVDELFKNWKAHFGSKLKERQELDLQTARLWSVALALLEVTENEFEIAFTQSLIQKWPPTTPADFVELARVEASTQFPDSYTAYTNAANGKYLHAVCYEAAVRVGLYEMRNQAQYVTLKIWKDIYAVVCNEYMRDTAKFEQNQLKLAPKSQSDTNVPASPQISLERQSEIAMLSITKIREILK